MKARTLIILALCAAVPALACAKKPKKQAEPVVVEEEEPEIVTEDCIMYTSLFHESAKNKQYADALDPWMAVYKTCPRYSKNVYVDGIKIVEWKMEQTKNDPAEYNTWRDLLMELYDKRMKYFGDDPKYPTAYILGQKGLDYVQYFPEDTVMDKPCGWMRESISTLRENSQMTLVIKFAEVSYSVFKTDPDKYREQYITDYQLCSEVFTAVAEAGGKNADVALSCKENLDQAFVRSGAADCDKLDELYAKVVKENINDLEALQKVMATYSRMGCKESSVFETATEACHRLNPSAESAAGMAATSIKKSDWSAAVKYLEQAASLSSSNSDKAKFYLDMAKIQSGYQKAYQSSVASARRALDYNPNLGEAYILIGQAWVTCKPYSQESHGAKAAILNKTVYWAAVDMFVKAKSVDPSCASKANSLIATYSKYFPTKEERFDLPAEFSGSTFFVGGWIGHTTTIR